MTTSNSALVGRKDAVIGVVFVAGATAGGVGVIAAQFGMALLKLWFGAGPG